MHPCFKWFLLHIFKGSKSGSTKNYFSTISANSGVFLFDFDGRELVEEVAHLFYCVGAGWVVERPSGAAELFGQRSLVHVLVEAVVVRVEHDHLRRLLGQEWADNVECQREHSVGIDDVYSPEPEREAVLQKADGPEDLVDASDLASLERTCINLALFLASSREKWRNCFHPNPEASATVVTPAIWVFGSRASSSDIMYPSAKHSSNLNLSGFQFPGL